MTASEGERHLETRLRQHGIPFVREAQIIPGRKFRADFRIGSDLLVEVEGGSWSGGRHVSGTGFERDCEKASLAAAEGFRVVRCTTAQVTSDQCIEWIIAALPHGTDE